MCFGGTVPVKHIVPERIFRSGASRRQSGMAKRLTPKPPEHRRDPTFLRAWRDFRDLNQDEAAEKMGIDRSTLSKIENGRLPYNQDLLERAALVYGCDPEDLLAIDPLKPDPPKLIYDRLRRASPDVQRQVMDVIDVLLKKSA